MNKKVEFHLRKKNLIIITTLVIFATLFSINTVSAEELVNSGKDMLLFHLVTDANTNDANACVAFNLAWVAVEKGLKVEMLFDSWAGYNIKEGDFWGKYQVPKHYRQLVVDAIGKEIDWKGGTYMDLLKYLKQKEMIVSANKTFLSLSGDDKKLPSFVEKIGLAQMVEHIANASGYVRY